MGTIKAGDLTYSPTYFNQGVSYICVARVAVGLLAVFGFSGINAVDTQVRIVLLERVGGNTVNLILSHRNGTNETLKYNVNIYRDRLVLATEARHNAICWFAFTRFTETVIHSTESYTLTEFPLIECMWKEENRSIVIPKLLINEEIKDFYFRIDPFEETIYWKHSSSQGIWATKVKSPEKTINLVNVANTIVTKNPFFAIDPLEGLVFMHIGNDWDVRAIPLNKAAAEPYVQHPQPLLKGITLDVTRKTVYALWTSYSTNNDLIHIGIYDTVSLVTNTSNWDVTSYNAKILDPQYCNNHLYFSGVKYNNVIKRHWGPKSTTVTAVVVASNYPRAFSVFEDRLPKVGNPCLSLNCSHLCLPEYKKLKTVRPNYECRCPDGTTLVDRNSCLHVTLVYSIDRKVYSQGYSNASAASTECPQTTGTSESKLCEIFRETPGAYLQVDFFREGWTTSTENCIRFHSQRTAQNATLHCLGPNMKLESFALDHLRGRLFWIESENDTISVPAYHLRSINLDSSDHLLDSLNQAITGPAASLALAPEYELLFWVQDESSLMKSDYQGQGRTILGYFSERQNRMLHYAANRIWWNEIDRTTNKSSFALYDLNEKEIRRLDKTNEVTGSIDNILIALTPPPLNPCEKSNCKVCIPKNDTSLCLCPDFMNPTGNPSDPCHEVTVLITSNLQSKASPRTFELKALSSASRETTKLFFVTLQDRPKRMTASYKGKIVCWTPNDASVCNCATEVTDTSQVWTVPKVNGGSKLLVLDQEGQNLFWNSGEPGSISMTSLSKQATYEFPSFSTPDINAHVTALDPERGIFFWADDKNQLHYRALYTTQNGSILLPGSDNITAIAVDTRGNILYCIQGNGLRSISYQSLFQGESNNPTDLLYKSKVFSGAKYLMYFEGIVLSLTPPPTSGVAIISALYIKSSRFITRTHPHTHKLFALYGSSYQGREWSNPCETSGCSHFCFLLSPLEANTDHTCACPANYNLTNERNCTEHKPALTPRLLTEPTEPTHTPPPDITDDTTSTLDDSTSADIEHPAVDNYILVTGVLVSLLLVVAAVWLTIWFLQPSRSKSHTIHPNENKASSTSAVDDPPNNDHTLERSANPLRLSLKYIIPPSELVIDKSKSLGEGQFGQVFQGHYQGKAVAVKTIKSADNSENPNLLSIVLSEFLHEIQIVAKIGAHPHIVQFFGAEISDLVNKTVFVVLELSPLGSLLDFVRIHSGIPTMQAIVKSSLIRNLPLESFRNGVPIKQRLIWAEQIALGMCYLQDKNILHGDLAARNVLVFDNAVVKLSDFGLSRSLYQYAMYEKKNLGPLPWRWMAVESLQVGQFSSKTDVWSYGVTLWEIFTSGFLPYPEQNWCLSFVELLIEGTCLQKSRHTPTQVYENLMLPCWKVSPEERPDFHQLLSLIPQIRNELGISHQLEPSMPVPRMCENETALYALGAKN